MPSLLGIVADVAAQLAAEIVADEQVDHAALGLRLERQLSLRLLEQRAEQRGQRQRFGKQLLDDRRIVMAGEDRVDHRPKPRDPPRALREGMATPSATSVLS